MASVSGIKGRFFAELMVLAIEFYFRHKTTIDQHLSSACVNALMAVAGFLSEIKALNPTGPS